MWFLAKTEALLPFCSTCIKYLAQISKLSGHADGTTAVPLSSKHAKLNKAGAGVLCEPPNIGRRVGSINSN